MCSKTGNDRTERKADLMSNGGRAPSEKSASRSCDRRRDNKYDVNDEARRPFETFSIAVY